METLHDIKFDHYRPQTKLRQGNVFTPVCDSVHRGREGGWSAQPPPPDANPQGLGRPPQMQNHRGWADPPMQTLPGLVRHPPGSTTGYDQQAGGTHPTGMHTCFYIFLVASEAKIYIARRKLTRLQFNKRMAISRIIATWNTNATEHNYKS